MKTWFANHRQMLEYSWNELYPDIFCFSTTRHGGCSGGEYASFNCNEHCGDDLRAVVKNWARLLQLLPGKVDALITPHQTHGTVVRVVDEAFWAKTNEERTELLEGVDALITSMRGVCIGAFTADCIPVFCYDARQNVVAVAHAGWRGTCARIVQAVLREMARVYGSKMNDVFAFIGPGISCDAFEVGDEVWEAFHKAGFPMSRISHRRDKWHIDLWEANRLQLLEEGLSENRIQVAGICTWSNNQDFFSARRQGIESGRILNGIMIKK